MIYVDDLIPGVKRPDVDRKGRQEHKIQQEPHVKYPSSAATRYIEDCKIKNTKNRNTIQPSPPVANETDNGGMSQQVALILRTQKSQQSPEIRTIPHLTKQCPMIG